MIEQASQGDEKEAAMGIDQDRTCAHVEYRCCTTDHGAKGSVSTATVKATWEDVT